MQKNQPRKLRLKSEAIFTNAEGKNLTRIKARSIFTLADTDLAENIINSHSLSFAFRLTLSRKCLYGSFADNKLRWVGRDKFHEKDLLTIGTYAIK